MFPAAPAQDPALETFYDILEKHWGGQAGSQPEAGDESSSDGGDGDDPRGDGGPVPAPIDVEVATQRDSVENTGVTTAAPSTDMPPPPIPSKESKSLPSSSSNPSAGGVLDPELRETALQRIAALKTLRKITLSHMYVLSS